MTGIAFLSLLLLASTAHASTIVNGGFETGTFAGWTVDPASGGSLLFVYALNLPFNFWPRF